MDYYSLVTSGLIKYQNVCNKSSEHTVALGYNDLGLCDTTAIALYLPWYQLIPRKARVFCLA